MPANTEGSYKYFGYAAATLTTIAFLPQAVDIYRNDDTKGLSLTTYVIYSIGLLLWIVYAWFDDDAPIMRSSFTSMVITLYIAFKIWQHQRNR